MRFSEMAAIKPYKSIEGLSAKQCWQFLQKNCRSMLEIFDKPLYRGSNDVGNKIIKPSTGLRMSEHTTNNHYTVLLDTSPYYRAWPPRSRSLICSCSAEIGSSYAWDSKHGAHRVYPVDGSRIAVASESDIWSVYVDAGEYSGYLIKLADYLQEVVGINVQDINLGGDKTKALNQLKEKFVDKGKAELFKSLSHAIDPERLGFELLSVSEFASQRSRFQKNECWTDGDCLILDNTTYNEIKNNHTELQ